MIPYRPQLRPRGWHPIRRDATMAVVDQSPYLKMRQLPHNLVHGFGVRMQRPFVRTKIIHNCPQF